MLLTEKMDEYNVLMAMESFTKKLHLPNLEDLCLLLISTNRVSQCKGFCTPKSCTATPIIYYLYQNASMDCLKGQGKVAEKP